MLPGNRKIVLEVIEEDPGKTIWQLRPLLKEKHKDWHVSAYSLVSHILGLNSAGLVRIAPLGNVGALSKWREEARNGKKTARLSFLRIHGTKVREIAVRKSLPYKSAQSIISRLCKHYPHKVSVKSLLDQDFGLKENTERWKSLERLILKLIPEIIDASGEPWNMVISLNVKILKNPSAASLKLTQSNGSMAKTKKKTLSRALKQTKCFPISI